VIVDSSKSGSRGFFRAVSICVFSLFFTLVTFALAFGDFVPVVSTKVLGVGRIQSALPATPVASADKFALATRAAGDITSEQAVGLSEPIAREVTINEPEPPAQDPTPVNTPAPAGNEATPDVNDGTWISTLATNYGTPGDGFLNKSTASGALTTTTSMGVAHKNLPLGTTIELYCPKTGLSCIAVVNDRGPYDGRPDTFDFQMGVTAALGGNTGWYAVQYRIVP
jgi:hypothetical protein